MPPAIGSSPYGAWAPSEPPKRPGGRPSWLVPAVIVGVVGVVAVVVAVFWPSGEDDETADSSENAIPGAETTTGSEASATTQAPQEEDLAGDIDALDIVLGDCWNAPEGAGPSEEDGTEVHEVETIEVVPCSDEHMMEAYAVFDLEDGPWPGQDVVADDAESGCLDRWEDFVGVPYLESSLDLYAFFPLERTWNQLGDREVVCSVVDPEGMTVGSLEGAGR